MRKISINRDLWKIKFDILIIVSSSIVLLPIYHIFLAPPSLISKAERKEICIRQGMNVAEIGGFLLKEGIIDDAKSFVYLAKIRGVERELKAGRYILKLNIPELDAVKILNKGGSISGNVTIPEGLTIKEVAAVLKKYTDIDEEEFLNLTNDKKFIEELGIDGTSLEGYLYPDTYNFYWKMKESAIIGTMVGRFKEIFTENSKRRAEQLGLKVGEIVTLASIIEKETAFDDEKPIISAVFHNRLKLGRPLQADPTIQYILPKHRERLLYKHLQIDSPYNTYKHKGLPPGPICSPEKASLIAALYPADRDYLYFVAKGDGSHIFSRHLKEHLNAKKEAKKNRGS